jgi:hypothetical protein
LVPPFFDGLVELFMFCFDALCVFDEGLDGVFGFDVVSEIRIPLTPALSPGEGVAKLISRFT